MEAVTPQLPTAGQPTRSDRNFFALPARANTSTMSASITSVAVRGLARHHGLQLLPHRISPADRTDDAPRGRRIGQTGFSTISGAAAIFHRRRRFSAKRSGRDTSNARISYPLLGRCFMSPYVGRMYVTCLQSASLFRGLSPVGDRFRSESATRTEVS